MSSSENTDTPPTAAASTAATAGASGSGAGDSANMEAAVLRQVEYYFSKENLQTDSYLVSKMNAQMWVPLETVLSFKLLRNLTNDVELIKRVLRRSAKVEMEEVGDQTLIRPRILTAQRITVVLRDAPKDIPEEEIKALFSNAAKITQLKPDIGDTWFVTFETEQDAQSAFDEARTKELRGQPVKVRVKSENLLKNFFPPGSEQPGQPGQFQGAPGFQPGFMPMMPPPFFFPHMRGIFGPGGFPMDHNQPWAAAMADAGRGGRGGPLVAHRAPQGRGGGRGGRGQGDKTERVRDRPGSGKGRQGIKPDRGVGYPTKLGPQDFPPLPSATKQTSGYSESFRKYTKEEIVSVLQSLQSQDPARPELPPKCPAVVDKPNDTIELVRKTEDEELPSFSEVAASAKSFAEAAITAKDIKPPEPGKRRTSVRRERAVSGGKGGQKK